MDCDPCIQAPSETRDSLNRQAVNEDPLALGGIALAWSFWNGVQWFVLV
jgi:hypothetical protein